MQTVAETPIFIRRVESLLSEDEHADLITYLATHPTAGDEIVGTGGVRKVRYAAMGRGKSGGNERADLTPEQRKSVRTFATAIKALRKRK